MTQNIFSNSVNINEEPNLKQKLTRRGFNFTNVNYAFWQGKKGNISITFYKSGKLVIQGPNATLVADELLDLSKNINGLEHVENLVSWIGTDESGKGDFFGSLAAAALYIEKKQLQDFILLGVQDCKSMTDNKIIAVAEKIRQFYQYEIVLLKPENYNRLYNQFKNLNKLLAKAHADAISNLIKKTNCNVVLADKFGNEKLLSEALQKNGHNIQLVQQTKAEINPAVAGASILARAEFLKHLDTLSQEFKISFPKGATTVINIAKQFVSKYGIENLSKVAKMHFKTVRKIYD